ncbi:MAG: glycoside hydrolase family 88 protein [Lachnospiraceae bacterium]|nr:glycoside hydrolase family 88 protein [Lachnospiraceae bacterium]
MSYVLVEHYPELKLMLSDAIKEATDILKRDMVKYASGDLYPARYANGKYVAVKNADPLCYYWEEGFWPGQLWLAYEATGDEAFRKLADKNVDDFYKRVDENNHIDWHHDLGFLYTPSCVSAYMLTGNETAKKAALMAAYSLSRRFRPRGQFIQSMSFELDEPNYKFIVDTMLNIPLLFWAAKETGEESYRQKALAHLNTTVKYAMREDGTTYHHFLMDEKTGGPIKGQTWQGDGDESCWSRGQAWVVYGLALGYGYTKDEKILGHFKKATDYVMNHMPEDFVPYWDFVYSDGSEEPRDSSAAAIIACGILEMAKHAPECDFMKGYLDKVAKMMRSMAVSYANKLKNGTEGLLLHGTDAKPQGEGIDVPLSFGDYFYMESLIRATRDWKSYW